MRTPSLALLVAASLSSTAAMGQVSVSGGGSAAGQVTLGAGGNVWLGEGLDPNRIQADQAGNVTLTTNFQASGSISGSQFNPGGAPITTPGGSISGAFFGPAGTPSGLVDVTHAIGSPRDASPRYAAPFLVSTATVGAVTPVPEPSSWVLMLAGAVGLAGWVSVRARRSAPCSEVAAMA